MSLLRRHVQILWTAAILLMAGGQFLPALEASCCLDEHGELHQSALPGSSNSCPGEDHRCHACGNISLLLTEMSGLPSVSFRSQAHGLNNESYGEGPCREIDYPPQLS